jgi:hypothetical protein
MAAKLDQTFVMEMEDLCLAMRSVTDPIFYLGDFLCLIKHASMLGTNWFLDFVHRPETN